MFTPTTPGLRTGSLAVNDRASTAPQVVDLSGTGVATPIKHVVIIFQENRSTDNLFHDPVLIAHGADIASSGLNSRNQIVPLKPAPLANTWDMGHNHGPFVLMYNGGKMNGADKIPLLCHAPNCPPPADANYTYVQASDVGPYFQMAEQYTFADRMFQTKDRVSRPISSSSPVRQRRRQIAICLQRKIQWEVSNQEPTPAAPLLRISLSG